MLSQGAGGQGPGARLSFGSLIDPITGTQAGAKVSTPATLCFRMQASGALSIWSYDCVTAVGSAVAAVNVIAAVNVVLPWMPLISYFHQHHYY